MLRHQNYHLKVHLRMMLSVWMILLLSSHSSAAPSQELNMLGHDEFESDCPAPNGFFADAFQCDKYYECSENVIQEKLCPDGMAFNDLNPKLERCDYLYQLDCSNRPDLQLALGTPDCPRANGYFPHPDPGICDKFSFCSAGTASKSTCPETTVFSLKTGTCTWPDQSGRADCNAKAVLNFTCPAETADIAAAHPLYADPNDCGYYFVCISGVTPRHNGCSFGEVFNSEIKACDAPGTVPACEKYYHDYFDEYFATLGAGSTRASSEVIQAALNSNYPVPESAQIRIEKPRINFTNHHKKPTQAPAPAAATESPTEADPTPEGNLKPNRSRRPGVRRKVTTPTPPPTTTTDPEYYYDYDYYEDIPAGEIEATPSSNTPAF